MSEHDDPILKVLVEARKLVAQGWTQDADARDAGGFIVQFLSENATRYCLSGAVNRAARVSVLSNGNTFWGVTWDTAAKALDVLNNMARGWQDEADAVHYNDNPGTKQSDVLALFDFAINYRRSLL